jgi:hypothetical protein
MTRLRRREFGASATWGRTVAPCNQRAEAEEF